MVKAEDWFLISKCNKWFEKKNLSSNNEYRKAVDSLDDSFLISGFKKFKFGGNLFDWVKILLYKQESCVMNSGFTTNYFNLEKGPCWDLDPWKGLKWQSVV